MTLAPFIAQPSALQGRRRSVVLISTHIGLVGVLCSVGLVVVLHVLRPDLNPASHFVSDYAVGPYHTLMTLAFSACGLGMLALVVGLYYGVAPAGRSWLGLVLLTVSGLCINLASWFHDAPQSSPAVLLDTVHDSIVQVSLISLALGALAWSVRFRKDSRWRAWSRPALLLALLMFVALLSFILIPVRLMGLAERGLLVLYLLWVCGVLIRLEALVCTPESRMRRLGGYVRVFPRELPVRSWHSPDGQASPSP